MTAKAAILSWSEIQLGSQAALFVLMYKVSVCMCAGSKMTVHRTYYSSLCVGPPVSLQIEVGGDVREDEGRMAYVAVESDSVVLRCSCLADPKPSVVWLRDGQVIETDLQPDLYSVETEYNISNRPIGNFTETLTIIAVMDSGSYTCSVSNDHGNSQAMEALDVIG